ncbi:MAG: serine/threonine protein kinase [Deltaproteobacteria bacterium]|nr:serine/threonine protein kinase [Deltaproteobacteria bacterium]
MRTHVPTERYDPRSDAAARPDAEGPLQQRLERLGDAAHQQTSLDGGRMHRAVRSRLLDESPPEVRIDRYLVLEKLGAGGMGVVYVALDAELERRIAIKLVRGFDGPRGREAQQRLVREARAMARLAHPNVVAVFDAGVHGDRVFIAMELVAGCTLREHVTTRTRSWSEVLAAYLQAGEGLAAVHAAGLVHRDFKPDNALVGDDGRVRVLDFGLAQARDTPVTASGGAFDDVDDTTQITATGKLVGTPAYMAPEQYAGLPADVGSDQFAFCVSLWEALYGQRPFDGRDAATLRRVIGSGRVTAPPASTAVPTWLNTVLRRGLAVEPSARWPSMTALLSALRDDPRPRRRRWRVLAAVLAIAGVGVGAWALERGRRLGACEDGDADIAARWSPAVAQRVGEAFAASRLVHAPAAYEHMRPHLDAWVDTWRVARRASCEAYARDGVIDGSDWSRRAACFDRQARRLGTLIEALAVPDRSIVERAPRAVFELPGPDECSDDARLAALDRFDGRDAAAADALAQRLADVQVLTSAGDLARARDASAHAMADAVALDDSALLAEARLREALVLYAEADYPGAARELEQAYFGALAVGAIDVALGSATESIAVVGSRMARFDEGLEWSRHARGLLDRQEHAREWFEGRIEDRLGTLEFQRGDLDAAVQTYQRGIALFSSAVGEQHPLVGELWLSLGSVYVTAKRLELAEDAVDRGERILVRAYGADAPALFVAAGARCGIAFEHGEYTEGLPHCERAVTLREAAVGPDHASLTSSLLRLAAGRMAAGEAAGARESTARVVELRRAKLGPQHPELATALSNLGVIDYLLDDNDAAEAHLAEALAIRRAVLPSGHPDIAVTVLNLADVAGARGQHARALALFEEAAALLGDAADDVSDNHRGRAQAGIGGAQRRLGHAAAAVEAYDAALRSRFVELGDPAARCEVRHGRVAALRALEHPPAHLRAALAEALTVCRDAGERAAELVAELESWQSQEIDR